MEELLKQLAAFGPGGVLAAIAIFVAWKKDQQVKELYETVIQRSDQMVDRYHGALTELNATVKALVEYAEDDE